MAKCIQIMSNLMDLGILTWIELLLCQCVCRSDNNFGQIYRDMSPANRIKRSFAQMSVVSLMSWMNRFDVLLTFMLCF